MKSVIVTIDKNRSNKETVEQILNCISECLISEYELVESIDDETVLCYRFKTNDINVVDLTNFSCLIKGYSVCNL